MVDLKSLGEATVALTALKSDAGKKLLAPLAEQLGIALGDLGNIYRFYQGECLEKIFTKWAASRGDKPALNQEEWRKVMPLLQLASVQGDEELQTRWAALLEHTVTTNNGFLPSFGQTLAQLTSDEAKFLDRLFNVVRNYPSKRRSGRKPVHYYELISVYDPSINPRINPAEEVFKSKKGDEQSERDDKLTQEELVKHYEKLTQAELVMHDLERLGILTREEKFTQTPAYGFTQYGLSFVRAMTPKG